MPPLYETWTLHKSKPSAENTETTILKALKSVLEKLASLGLSPKTATTTKRITRKTIAQQKESEKLFKQPVRL